MLTDAQQDLELVPGLLEAGAITPVFRPIVDLLNTEVFGYEILSRVQRHLRVPRGDDMIRLCARVLPTCLIGPAGSARIGHIGGDDFVSVIEGTVPETALEDLCQEFDSRKPDLFPAEDAARGRYPCMDRQGCKGRVPLVTLSLAAATRPAPPWACTSGRSARSWPA